MRLVKFSPRICFFLGFAACATLLAVGAYLQFVEELEPCPLCISQRLAILATGVIFLIGGFHNRGRKVYAVLSAAAALLGASVSARRAHRCDSTGSRSAGCCTRQAHR